jgi:aminopeptidase
MVSVKNQLLEKYARLVVKTGINIQKNQLLVITSPIECALFTRLIAQYAYEAGARDVTINWKDELFTKTRFLKAPEEVFADFPKWQQELYISNVKQGAAFISILASDPELLKDVNPQRIATAQKASNIALKEFREPLMSSQNAWCVVSMPTLSWAKKVFPDVSEEEAMDKLWGAIFKTVRVDTEDPVSAWREHNESFKSRVDFLNDAKFASLTFKNSLGTDITIELPENHIWMGGSEYTPEGVEFFPNMPTEEIFTLPKRTGVNGHVVSSMPLVYGGNLIEGFSLTFKDGQVTDFSAEKGYDTLKTMLDADEGARYLGEVALVPYDSPISNLKILFFNTLFDENASCHLALGKAYPTTIENGEKMSEDELKQAGVNDSLIHEDFMIGTKDMEITGTTADGKIVSVFENGNFTF